MSLKSPKSNRELPHAIQKLLNKMYARDTGFSGSEILDFFSQYSMQIERYPWEGGAPSRWQIFEDCLAKFSRAQQETIIADLLDYIGPMAHGYPGGEDVHKMREWLHKNRSPMAEPMLKTETLNWTHVNQSWAKALERVSSDPAGAITSARALLESVCKHILDNIDCSYEKHSDLRKLYRTTARALTLSPEQQKEDIFRQVLGGCATVASGLAGMRNIFGDAHGAGPSHIEPEVRHARLAVNAACTVALFLIESYLASTR